MFRQTKKGVSIHGDAQFCENPLWARWSRFNSARSERSDLKRLDLGHAFGCFVSPFPKRRNKKVGYKYSSRIFCNPRHNV